MNTQDLSDPQQALEQLQASEERFRQLADVMPEIVWIARPDGFVDYYNERWYEFTGSLRSAGGDETWLPILHSDDVERFKVSREVAIRSGHLFQEELRLRESRSGEYRWFLARMTPVKGERGQVVWWVGTFTDIDAMKRVEADLRLRDLIIREVKQGIFLFAVNQPDLPIVFVNPAFERLTGYTAAEVIGKSYRFLQGTETRTQSVSQLQAAIQGEQPCSVEILNYKKEGTPFWNALSISPVRDGEGRLTHFVGVFHDGTEQCGLESNLRQAQKMEALGLLASGVAHDFNNLLLAINGYGELVKQELHPDGIASRWVSEMVDAGEQAAVLIRQLLAFSRQQPIVPRHIELNAVITNLEKMLRRLIREDVELVVELAPDLWMIEADAGRIEHAVIYLVINAQDAMPCGGKITVETSNAEPQTDNAVLMGGEVLSFPCVRLKVCDEGHGMSPEAKSRIFDSYFTNKEAGEGTGLGLYIVFGVVKASGGAIKVQSKVEGGTTFEIFFPRSSGETTAIPTSDSCPALPSAGHETVLLVEDDIAVRGVLAMFLNQAGYRVLMADDGVEALQVAEEHGYRIHLLVSDVIMPRMGGRELADRFLARNPQTKVLFVSGYTGDVSVSRGVQQDQFNFVQKPFSQYELIRKIRAILHPTS